MLGFLLKRLLLALPTLWVIATVVFIGTRLIPGNQAAYLQQDESASSRASAASKQRVYRQYLQKTGQHLPLFYFNLRTLAEPDTLRRVFADRDYQLLQQLTLRYGNWPLIDKYVHQLQNLSAQIRRTVDDPAKRAFFNRRIDVLFSAPSEDKTRQMLTLLGATTQSAAFRQAIIRTENAYQQLITHATPYKNLIPVWQWHGTKNQYHQWLAALVAGDVGSSFREGRPVTEVLAEAIGNTLLLTTGSLALIFLLAILLNLWITNDHHRRWRQPVLTILYLADTIPVFLLALLLLTGLSGNAYINLFPVYGLGNQTGSWLTDLGNQLYHLTIPMLCLTVASVAYVTRQLYVAMQEVKTMDFILTARAKGLPESRVISKHTFRNALLPLITLFTGFFPALIGGALVIEVIFAIPGTGRLMVGSVLARDYPVVLGIVLLLALVKILAHILADMLYFLADPRIEAKQ